MEYSIMEPNPQVTHKMKKNNKKKMYMRRKMNSSHVDTGKEVKSRNGSRDPIWKTLEDECLT
jgi:hypothetical protein